ncbi:HNH endonuclease [Brucellaceae bacterium D45D]
MMIDSMTTETIALYESANIPRFSCALCERDGYAEFAYEKLGLCSKCVCAAAHEFLMAHSGAPDPRFLTSDEYNSLLQADQKNNKYKKKPIPYELRKKVFERDKYRCQICDTHIDLVADHKYPEVLGGEASLENMQCLCRSCNSKKGARV